MPAICSEYLAFIFWGVEMILHGGTVTQVVHVSRSEAEVSLESYIRCPGTVQAFV